MNDLGVIDRFLGVFSQYIDSGFGLLGGEVAFLTATLVMIDMTLAGLFWAMGSEEVIAKLIKKTLYVGAFAYIIGNFNSLAGIIFRSFAGLGLLASGSGLTQGQLLQPGRLAAVGVTAGQPILQQIGQLSGFPEVFLNIDSIVVLFLAWIIVVVSFFILAVQLFVTLIEFKLTTLAGFVLVPFALWNKTAFLAERVLGNVVSSAGTTLSLNQALAIMLGSLTLLGLGIFGPGIATGLVSGAPQLGAGAAAGTALGVGGLAVAGGAAVATGGAAVAAGSRLAARSAVGAVRVGSSAAAAYRAGAATAEGSGARAFGAGVANVVRTGAQAVGEQVAARAKAVKDRFAAAASAGTTGGTSNADGTAGTSDPAGPASESEGGTTRAPDWARRLQRRQNIAHGASSAAHAVRSGDHGGSGASPSLDDPSNE